MPNSAYIHIPFCKSKCKYCSFVSGINLCEISKYVDALIKDIKANYQGEILKTLYFGGGTPSLLNTEQVKNIISNFKLAEGAEVTFEVNPDDADLNYFKSLLELGINRISMGTQSFNDDVLKLIGRRHCSLDTKNAVHLAKKAGFKNISVDLIYGLPNANIKKDLKEILKLDIKHVSTYGLKIEKGSYFYKHPPENLPDEDAQADMYIMINETLEKFGYKRYEISNFSKMNYESQHNLTYWENAEYYGFGLSAHGYKNTIRYSKTTNLENYINNPVINETEHQVTFEENLEEEIFLGLRKADGISISDINSKFDIDFEKKYEDVLRKYAPIYIEKTPSRVKFTLKGVLVSNVILADFLMQET